MSCLGVHFALTEKEAAQLRSLPDDQSRLDYLQEEIANSYGFPLSEEDFGYTWDWFQGVRNLYIRAAQEGRFVLFTADQ